MAGCIAVSVLTGLACLAVPESPCERIEDVRSLPMKGPGSDEAYLFLMEAGEAAVPCLIDKIVDATPMPDPRMAPSFQGTVVGDIAIFILVDITETEFEALLPQDVKERFPTRGVYAYFDYVADPEHRMELQERWREWWRRRSSRGE